MTNPRLDQELSDFLDAQKRAERDGATIGAVLGKIDSLWHVYETLATKQAAQDHRLKRHGEDIRKLKRVNAARGDSEEEAPVEDSGLHQLEDYRLAEAERKLARDETRRHDSVMFWKRQRVGWIATLIGATIGSTTTAGPVAVGYTIPDPT